MDPNASRRGTSSLARMPTTSNEGASGSAPDESITPWVGLTENRPHDAAGTRIEPAVSVPTPKSHTPPATADAVPDDEPPVNRSGYKGFIGGSLSPAFPIREYANWSSFVNPSIVAPASLSFSTTVAVTSLALCDSRQRGCPNDDVWPATTKRSLTTNVLPESTPGAELPSRTGSGTRQLSLTTVSCIWLSRGVRMPGQSACWQSVRVHWGDPDDAWMLAWLARDPVAW